jgi:uncharacterized lipoprotein YmbA
VTAFWEIHTQSASFSSHGIARRRPIDCYVAVSVMRFDGDATGQISVVARWSLRDADGKELVMRRSAYLDSDPLLTAQRP